MTPHVPAALSTARGDRTAWPPPIALVAGIAAGVVLEVLEPPLAVLVLGNLLLDHVAGGDAGRRSPSAGRLLGQALRPLLGAR